MPTVFINYRGSDEPWVANWLCSEFTTKLGPGGCFLDSRSIQPGEEYAQSLLNQVRGSEVLIVVIGAGWYTGRLIDDPEDWVRKEIREAFTVGVRVLPVLVGDTRELVSGDLPEDIARLAGLQHLRVRHREAHHDIPRVVGAAVEPRVVSRCEVEELLREILPPVQQYLGNLSLLADVAWSLLEPDERPEFLAPCRFSGRTPGSAVLLVTNRGVCVADLDNSNNVRQVLRFATGQVTKAALFRRRRLGLVPTADLKLTLRDGGHVMVRGLLRGQAESVLERLNGLTLFRTA